MSFLASARARTAAVTIVLSVVAASAGAQDSTRTFTLPDSLASWYRDPHTAQMLGSFIPGAGHVYAGEKLRGVGLGAAAVIGIAPFLHQGPVRQASLGVALTVGW